jgi:hypothetical protein
VFEGIETEGGVNEYEYECELLNNSNILNYTHHHIDYLRSKETNISVNLTDSRKKIKQIEKIQFSFYLRDKKHFIDDTLETCQLFFKLVALGLEGKPFPMKLINREFTISNVIETKDPDVRGWCSDPEAQLLYLSNASYFRILSGGSNQYRIYIYNDVNDLSSGRFYGTGLFYITVMYTHYINTYSGRNIPKIESNGEKEFFSKYNLSDVTKMVLESNDSSTESSYLVAVCDKVFDFIISHLDFIPI